MTSVPAPRAPQADGRVDPVGVRSPRPRLTWKIDSSPRASTFRLLGASSRDALEKRTGDVFDITTAQTWFAWPGHDLASRERVWWAVCADGTAWSEPAFVEAPLWTSDEWQAASITHPEWIAPGVTAPESLPELRTSFEVGADVVRARLYLTAAGVVIPRLNGRRVIDAELEPGYSDLSAGTLASAWDVTEAVRAGRNTLDLALAGGIAYLPPGERYTKFVRVGEPVWARARLEIELADATTSAVVTDDSWQARLGPITVSHWYGGETWVEGHATEWVPAVAVAAPRAVRWRGAPAVQVVDVLRAVAVEHDGDTRRIDFGVNSAGRPRLRLAHAEPGREIVLRPGELRRNGVVDQSTTGSPIWDALTPAGADVDWAPAGVYHGARYWDVAGLSAQEPDDAISFEVMRAGNRRVGSFTSSDPFLNRLHQIIDRAVQSNMYSVFTDCPHREKLGWLEQLHYCFDVLARGYDVQAHLEDMVRHMIEAQTRDGLVPNTAPELVVFDEYAVKGDIDAFRSDPNWGRAIVEVPWRLYRHYGDARILAEAMPAVRRYLAYVESRSADDILDFGLGDWIEVDTSTPRDMVATHGWASLLDTAAAAAAAAGDQDAAETWRARAAQVWAAFGLRFRDAGTGVWGSGSQGSWALAWSARGTAAQPKREIVAGLLDAIARAGHTLTVGEVSLPHLIRALTDSGHADTLDGLIRRADAPGYGHQLAEGATALAESWQGAEGRTGVASQNHFMLGVIDDWLTGDVAGLRQAEASVGWQRVVVAPRLVAGVDAVRTEFDSPQGRMTVAWRRAADGVVHVAAELPSHVQHDVVLPADAVFHHSLVDLDDAPLPPSHPPTRK
ncbi:family 78 glycoside hydrolase catalytic domain [Microbacterium sp. NPDC091313]